MVGLYPEMSPKRWSTTDTADCSSCSLDYKEVAYVQPEVTHL